MEGWIKIFRSIRENWIWQDERKLKWWLDILLEVNHTGRKVSIGYKVFDVNRGESIRSLKGWGDRWGVSKSVVNNFFKMLQNENMITLKNETVTIRLTVCKYDSYQSEQNANETQEKRKKNATVHKQELKERKEVFREQVLSNTKYPTTMLEKFVNYWSEHNEKGKKMRFEMAKNQPFNISLRLATWAKRDAEYNQSNKPQQQFMP